MNDEKLLQYRLNRRLFLGRSGGTIGLAALASLSGQQSTISTSLGSSNSTESADLPYFPPRAKRVIYLFQSGGPSHIDLFDYKPRLRELHGQELPDSVRGDQRITGMTNGQTSFPVVAPMVNFQRHGECGAWVSDHLPHTAKRIDDITIIRSLHTKAINHDPAVTCINTGTQQLGHPSTGAWVSYGLGSINENLPAYVVLHSRSSRSNMQPLFARLWGAGFLPSNYQGVQFRSGGDPVLYLSNPAGVNAQRRRWMLDSLAELNGLLSERMGDPEIETRISQYEMAFRMQSSVPQLMDLSDEPDATFELYGKDSRKPGTYARNCLLARRLAERNVRFIQLFHRGWDHHSNLPTNIKSQCREIDQASAALLTDLKRRGLLDETLVIWGGEFGRTIYSQGKLTKSNHGRDHHGRCFTIWMAGGGIKAGFKYGRTDDYCYNILENPMHIGDFNATLLHCLGVDHRRLTYNYQGLDQRLTGVEQEARVVREILA